MKRIYIFIFCIIPLASFAQWKEIVLPNNLIVAQCFAYENVLFARASGSFDYYWSFDNGDTWQNRCNWKTGFIAYKNKLFSITTDSIKVSLDSGLTFQSTKMFYSKSDHADELLSYNSTTFHSQTILNYHDTLFIAGVGKYYKSYDNGNSWYRYSYSSPFQVFPSFFIANDTTLFHVISDPSGYCNSCLSYQNKNNNWQHLLCTPQCNSPYAGSSIIVDAMFIDSLIFYSNSQLNVRHPNGTTEAFFTKGEAPGYMLTYGDTIYMTTTKDVYKAHKNNYSNWQAIGGLPEEPTGGYRFFILNNYLFVPTYSRLFRMELSPITNANSFTNNLEITIFPNPANDKLNITLPNHIKTAQITINDMQGRCINTYWVTNGEHSIDVSKLNPGIYLVQIKSEQGMSTKKIVINQ